MKPRDEYQKGAKSLESLVRTDDRIVVAKCDRIVSGIGIQPTTKSCLQLACLLFSFEDVNASGELLTGLSSQIS